MCLLFLYGCWLLISIVILILLSLSNCLSLRNEYIFLFASTFFITIYTILLIFSRLMHYYPLLTKLSAIFALVLIFILSLALVMHLFSMILCQNDNKKNIVDLTIDAEQCKKVDSKTATCSIDFV